MGAHVTRETKWRIPGTKALMHEATEGTRGRGNGGGKMASVCDYLLDVPSDVTPRIQEVHLLILHILAEEIEKKLC